MHDLCLKIEATLEQTLHIAQQSLKNKKPDQLEPTVICKARGCGHGHGHCLRLNVSRTVVTGCADSSANTLHGGELNRVYVVYTDMHRFLTAKPNVRQCVRGGRLMPACRLCTAHTPLNSRVSRE